MTTRTTFAPRRRLALALAAALALGGCEYIAVQTAPAKPAATTRSEAALRADALFWQTLRGGDYNGIETAMRAVKGAYLADPGDALTAAHVGLLHLWRLSERERVAPPPPSITDDAVMARKYFQEAVALNPADARFKGFLASAMLAEGTIHHDEKLRRQGFYTLMDSVAAYPEFNLFIAGNVLSGLPAESARYQEGLGYQWRSVDECVGEKVDRREPSFGAYMRLATTEGPKRVCWNTWMAPHNFEGFFLNMGDMLVKAGDWQIAQKIYANARLSPTYGDWKFKPQLEARIAKASDNVAVFRSTERGKFAGDQLMMNKSAFSCMACHQQ